MIKYLRNIALCLSCAVSLLFSVTYGQTADAGAAAVPAPETDELTMEQNLSTPEVPKKLATYVKNYMKREALALHKLGYKVETMRKGEVVIATIPTDRLFAPNDTLLMPSAGNDLKNFLPYFRTPDKFKVVLAIHTDDSGSDDYLSALAEKRVVALYDYFDNHAANTDALVGYPIAAIEPLEENTTRGGRAANRRLEIYIVPSNALFSELAPSK